MTLRLTIFRISQGSLSPWCGDRAGAGYFRDLPRAPFHVPSSQASQANAMEPGSLENQARDQYQERELRWTGDLVKGRASSDALNKNNQNCLMVVFIFF